MSTNITEQYRHAFLALTSGDYGNFSLFSVFINDTPGAAIVAVNECSPAGHGGEPEYELQPLFVSLTPCVTITNDDGREI